MTRTNVVLPGVLVLLMVVMAVPLFAQSQPVRVYVFTEDSEFRTGSVKDIQEALRNPEKKTIALVESSADAEITLEVMRPDWAPSGVLVMAKDDKGGTVVYARALTPVFSAALRLAATQGVVTLVDREAGIISMSLKGSKAHGRQARLSINVSSMQDGRTQVQVATQGFQFGFGGWGDGPSTREYFTGLRADIEGQAARSPASEIETMPKSGVTLGVKLTAGNYSTDIIGSGGDWRRAAREIGTKIDLWIKVNDAKIPRK